MLARRNQSYAIQTSPRHGGMGEARADSLLEIAWRQKALIALCVAICLLGAAAYLLVSTKFYTATSRLYVQRQRPRVAAAAMPEDNTAFLFTQREIVRSTPVLAMAIKDLAKLPTFEAINNRFAYLKKEVDVEVGKKDELITVSFDSPYPEDAVKVVTAIVDGYMAFQSRQQRSTAGDVLKVLQEQKARTERELDAKVKTLQDFRIRQSLLSTERDRTNVMMERLKTLSDSLNLARVETLNARGAYDEISRTVLSDPEKAAKVRELLRSSSFTAVGIEDEQLIRQELFRTETSITDARRRYGEKHPSVQLLQGRIDQLHIAYAAAVQRKYELARQKEADIEKLLADQQKESVNEASKAEEYARMQVEVDRLQKNLDVLDGQIKEVNLSEDGVPVITVLEPARAEDKPTYPSKTRSLALALLAGLAAGLGLACVRDRYDAPLDSARQIRAAIGAPVLGVIPRSSQVRGLLLDEDSDISEACRGLYEAVIRGVPSQQCKTILSTSPARGDGKTTVSTHLAAAIARSGKRVLLVDADFRAPAVSRLFELTHEAGLSNILEGESLSEGTIHETSVEGLDVLPCGTALRDPLRLLNTERFTAVLEHLVEVYDHVVLDAPPAVAVDDALIVSASADITLLVLRAGRANRRLSEQARQSLTAVGANIVGVVVNDVQPWSVARYDGVYEETEKPRRGRTGASESSYSVELRTGLARRPAEPQAKGRKSPPVQSAARGIDPGHGSET